MRSLGKQRPCTALSSGRCKRCALRVRAEKTETKEKPSLTETLGDLTGLGDGLGPIGLTYSASKVGALHS